MRAAVPTADVAIGNAGGLRAPLPAGPLTYGRLYELTPFDNREALLTLTGAELRDVIRRNLQTRGSDLILLSGVRATFTCRAADLHVEVATNVAAFEQWEVRLLRLLAKTAIAEVRDHTHDFAGRLDVGS